MIWLNKADAPLGHNDDMITLNAFITCHANEGTNLKAMAVQRLNGIQAEVSKVLTRMPDPYFQ